MLHLTFKHRKAMPDYSLQVIPLLQIVAYISKNYQILGYTAYATPQ